MLATRNYGRWNRSDHANVFSVIDISMIFMFSSCQAVNPTPKHFQHFTVKYFTTATLNIENWPGMRNDTAAERLQFVL